MNDSNLGVCCYGGVRSRDCCRSCAAWRAFNDTRVTVSRNDLKALLSIVEDAAGKLNLVGVSVNHRESVKRLAGIVNRSYTRYG